jgi:hypothetical protein
MTSSEKLRLLLIRDTVSFAAMTAYFFIPGDYSMAAILLGVGALWLAGKKLKGVTTKLEASQKRIYFASTCVFMTLWLGLLLSWIIRHSSPPAWAMGSLGIIVLLVLWYAAYEQVYGASPKV